MFRKAKVGDRVWDVGYGWGSVVLLLAHSVFTMKVLFESFNGGSIKVYYTHDGHEQRSDQKGYNPNQTLFWDEIKFEIPPAPKRAVIKDVEIWLNIYDVKGDEVTVAYGYASRLVADASANDGRVACEKTTITYKVEE